MEAIDDPVPLAIVHQNLPGVFTTRFIAMPSSVYSAPPTQDELRELFFERAKPPQPPIPYDD